jgi:hypothetical protein
MSKQVKSVEKNDPLVRARKIRESIRQIVERVLTEELKPLILDQDEIGDVCLLINSSYSDLLKEEGGPTESGPKVEAARRRLKEIEAKLNFEVDAGIQYALAKMLYRRSGPCSVANIHCRSR